MAAPTASRPGRALAVTALLLLVLGGAMFVRGATSPELGLDLQGGTSVTLVPKQGSKVTDENLGQAVEIIRQRVDAFGVAESEITTQGGRNIIISVPGTNQRRLVKLVGTTAQLRFRQVLQAGPPLPATAQTPTPSPAPDASPSPEGTVPPGTSPAPGETATPGGSPERTSGRALSRVLTQGAAGPASPQSDQTPAPRSPAPQSPAPQPPVPQPPPADLPPELAQQFAELDCTKPENRQGGRDVPPDEHLVTCDQDGAQKFVLAPASVLGKNVSGASAQLTTGGAGWQVLLNFDSAGADDFSRVTQEVYQQPPPRNQVAIVLDGLVVSAPAIQEPIPGGQAQITGQFTQKEAEDLANVLKFGALPIAFDPGEVLTISPTLGQDQLDAGLLAGAIGLGLVIVYSMLYYRMLGVVVIASLAVAGAITYATVSLLGDIIGFRLTLAGVAGLIVAIGITADSFIVYFERLRDEVREGRSLRAAVEYGWVRARRTIITADAVSLLAAVVLYLLSVGSVRGFAFTLGLTTIVDVIVVFLFTKPMVATLARTKFFAEGHPLSGVDPARLGATRRAPSEVLVGRRRPREA